MELRLVLFAFVFIMAALVVLPTRYIMLCRVMKAAGIPHPPYLHFFLVHGAFGGLLFSLGCTCVAYPIGALLFVIPICISTLAILVSSLMLYPRPDDSRYHRSAFKWGMWYCLAIVGIMCITAFNSFV